MNEPWICDGCRSVNRPQTPSCYRCGRPLTTRTGRLEAGAASSSPTEPRARPALTPGLDDDLFESAWTVKARNRYVSVWRAGYAVAAMLAVSAIAAGLTAAYVAFSFALPALGRTAGDADRISALQRVGVAFGLLLGITLVAHSAFLALVDLDLPALGGGTPRYLPLRAAFWWLEARVFVAALADIAWLPITLLALFSAGAVPAAIVAVGAAVVAAWLFGSPRTWLTRPCRLLYDLADRLALPGTDDRRIAGYWVAAWATGNGLLVLPGPIITLLAVSATVANGLMHQLGRGAVVNSSRFGEFFSILLVAGAIVAAAAEAVELGLMAWLTARFSARMRVREEWIGASEAKARESVRVSPDAVPDPAVGLLPGPSTPVAAGHRTASRARRNHALETPAPSQAASPGSGVTRAAARPIGGYVPPQRLAAAGPDHNPTRAPGRHQRNTAPPAGRLAPNPRARSATDAGALAL